MKKTGTILIMAITLLSSAACSGREMQNNSKSVSFYEKGLEMTAELDMLAENEEFAKLFTNDTVIGSTIAAIGSLDYSKPEAVYEIAGIEEGAFKFLISESDIKLDEKIQAHVKERFGVAVASLINGRNGAEFIAATSILTVGDSFLYKGLEKQITYLFLYGGKYGSIVTFIPHEDNIVEATANIIMQESLVKIESADDIASLFNDITGFSDLTVTEINE